jgi:para-nitrobenzyl esterase
MPHPSASVQRSAKKQVPRKFVTTIINSSIDTGALMNRSMLFFLGAVVRLIFAPARQPGATIMMIAALGVAAPSIAAINEPVNTEAGLVSGVPADDPAVTMFKGIPYAAPPVGDLRWRAPRPVVPWQGIRKADQFGSECLQSDRNSPVVGSEDCLFLNVWTGADSATERRPVVVWSYSNGFRGNTSANPLFDGEGLARMGVVVVTSNYRAGVFGFLATPELSKESGHNSSGNYGMLDQIAVLQWVNKNIAAFGGDPNRVTIAGQSAGGLSTLILVQSPLARGLFHGAIMESRATGIRTSLKDAERDGIEYAAARGAHSLKELRAMPWQKLKEGDQYDQPVTDDYVIPSNFYQMYVDGLQHDVPMMIGNAKDESGAQPHPRVTLDQFQSVVKKKYDVMADEFMKLYPASTDQEAGLMKNTAAREDGRMQTFLVATQGKHSNRNKSYAYFWTHAPPGPDSDRQGAYHMSEINYIFNNLYATDRPWTDKDRSIADMMSSYWANFAATGNPNGKGLPEWPALDRDSPVVMEVGDHFALMPPVEKSRADFIRRYYETHAATAGRWQ